ncbi:MAG TPA: Ig-like domain-containing protein [Ferruginibacter sp.]|nr:Ig-like domain-containing protein [Ferruginibacter sp.]HRO17564.1 Ig-like domain-containing protein [Ferruginibacter sp.]HRQ21384.1 Ig-like domain-containing protein [Ferruginibacter sp.]
MKSPVWFLLGLGLMLYTLSTFHSGCAQIGMPTGGPKDSLPPVLVEVTPPDGSTLFNDRTIRFTFNEYLDVKDAFNNVILSPLPGKNPTVTFNRRTMVVRLRDTLKPNTTYSIQFGNAVTDYNEGNILKDFSYVFSTGNTIDSFKLSGNVLLAESGLPDTTLMVYLYSHLHDSAVRKLKPDYITRVRGGGAFQFSNLPQTPFRVYALKDADGGKTYNQVMETFAFSDETVIPSYAPEALALLAYQQEKQVEKPITTTTPKKNQVWKLQNNLSNNRLNLLETLLLDYSRPVILNDTATLLLTDSTDKPVEVQIEIDSTRTRLLANFNKQPGMAYQLILPENLVQDTLGNTLPADTLQFTTFTENDYGIVTLRFNNIPKEKNLVIQFVQNNKVSFSAPVTGNEWKNNLFPPGSYDIRILYDDNANGVWDPGNYELKQQPEKAITLSLKLSVRAGWETDQEINL